MAVAINLLPSTTANPTIAITFSWTAASQCYYSIRWRYHDITSWNYSRAKTQSTTTNTVFAANTFGKNTVVEWQVRVWTGVIGSEVQNDWSSVKTINMQVPVIGEIPIQGSSNQIKLRVVALNNSADTSNIRIKTTSAIAEFDMVSIPHIADSGVHIKINNSTVKAIAKTLPDFYGNYLAYSESSAYQQYGNYYNYSNYGNSYNDYSDSGGYSDGGYGDGGGYSDSGYGDSGSGVA